MYGVRHTMPGYTIINKNDIVYADGGDRVCSSSSSAAETCHKLVSIRRAVVADIIAEGVCGRQTVQIVVRKTYNDINYICDRNRADAFIIV